MAIDEAFRYVTPRSILDARTAAIERTWAERLDGLRARESILFNLDTDDPAELDRLMQMYGSPKGVFSYDRIPKQERVSFLSLLNRLHRTAGTIESVRLLAELLTMDRGYTVQNVEVTSGSWRLTYNGVEARYEGLHRYDNGLEHARQQVEVVIRVKGGGSKRHG